MKRLWILLVALALLLAGCGGAAEDGDPVLELTEGLLSAIADDQFSRACGYADPGFHDELEEGFGDMVLLMEGVGKYSLRFLSMNSHTLNGVTTTRMSYLLVAQDRELVVSAALTEGDSGLSAFQLTPREQTSLHYTGTLGHMEGANLAQWGFIALWAATVGFMVWTAVDCWKREKQHRVLWLLGILLVTVMLTGSVSGGSVTSRVNIGLILQHSALVRYGDGSVTVRLLVPLGALLYRMIRRPAPKTEEPGE